MISPKNLAHPTPHPYKDLLCLDKLTLMALHGFLMTQVQTPSQIKWLYGVTMTPSQITSRHKLFIEGSFEQLNSDYCNLCCDAWLATKSENKHLFLINRCQKVFEAAMRDFLPEETRHENSSEIENFLFLKMHLSRYPENIKTAIHNHIFKPLADRKKGHSTVPAVPSNNMIFRDMLKISEGANQN